MINILLTVLLFGFFWLFLSTQIYTVVVIAAGVILGNFIMLCQESRLIFSQSDELTPAQKYFKENSRMLVI
jgi:hypothetical protein